MSEDISFGYTSIPVLQFLWGRRLDEYAGAYISALRPSSVRISSGMVKCDARAWRVTVYVNETEEYITRIEQEVEVMLPEDCRHGDDLYTKSGVDFD